MIFKKALYYLKKLFLKEEPNKKYIEKMKKILNVLEEKAINIEAQLDNEKDERKRKSLKLRLKVISKQKNKGERLIQDRGDYSYSPKINKVLIKPVLYPRINR